MKTLIYITMILLVSSSCKNRQQTEEWIQLFNGENLEGWTPKFAGFEAGVNFKNTFGVTPDGILEVNYDEHESFNYEFGHLITNTAFSHYKLRVEYQFVGKQIEGGPGWAYRNNGLMIHSQPAWDMKVDQDFPISVEVQILGGEGNDQRTNLNVCTPGTLVDINGEQIPGHCYNSELPVINGDQWTVVEIEVYGDSLVKHIFDGEVVLEYTNLRLSPDSDVYEKRYSTETGARLTGGYIAIQAESHPTRFRRIELLDLSKK